MASFAGSTDYKSGQSTALPFTIGQATPSVTVTDAGGAFNGQPFPATASVAGVGGTQAASLEGVTPTLTYYASATVGGTPMSGVPTDAGTYTVVASFAGSADYKAAQSAPLTFAIGQQATPIVTVTDLGGTFSGQAFPATASVAGVVSGVDTTPAASLEGVSPTLTYYVGGTPISGPPAAAGTYTVVASFAGSTDYQAKSAQVTFTIGQATPSVTVTDAGGAFSGQPFPATASVAGVGGTQAASLEGVTPTLTYYASATVGGTPMSGVPTDAGTYTVVASFAGSANYKAAQSAPLTFAIGQQATPIVTVTDLGGTFSGQAFPATASVAGVVSGVDTTPAASLEGVSPTLTYYVGGTPISGPPAAAGTYTVVASFAGSTDYQAKSAQVTFTIGQATPSVTVTDAGGTFTGQPFPATASVAGVGGTQAASLESVTPTLTYYAGGTPLSGAPAAAGTYTVVASFAGSTDYKAAQSTALPFTIGQATPSVTVTDAGGTFTGQPFPATASVAGVGGTQAASLESVTPTLTYYAGGTPLSGGARGRRHVHGRGILRRQHGLQGGAKHRPAVHDRPGHAECHRDGRRRDVHRPGVPGHGQRGGRGRDAGGEPGKRDPDVDLLRRRYTAKRSARGRRHVHRGGDLRRQHGLQERPKHRPAVHDRPGHAECHRDGPRRHVYRPGVPGHGQRAGRGRDPNGEPGKRDPDVDLLRRRHTAKRSRPRPPARIRSWHPSPAARITRAAKAPPCRSRSARPRRVSP